ncbi:DUF1990 domain-containing protein [Actinoplanes sp. Pm04-4]|uniref:DUF1990 domain-containing protein n=1 Tax=Paractinoplanes pyxinae TaxID=2997416 RepID=A0ABT4BAI6_9ACTN|nr:DUF1990 domain-containing protein [Actinoplanes pyxinae]MCY1143476.1 DUF1990 domain-containing protein [Actinoplanes pyxinae]
MDKSLTYAEVGATREGQLPAGYEHVFRDARLGQGRATYEKAANGLFHWRMHRAAGLKVHGVNGPAAVGVDVTLRLLVLSIPCRVVYTVDEPNRRGFGYGTLPGHPESGEEAFFVVLKDDGEVRFELRAFSRPANLLVRLGSPVAKLAQRFATDRYVKAMQKISR